MIKAARAFLLALFLYLLLYLLRLTWRVRVHSPATLTPHLTTINPCIFAHWHGDEIALFQLIGKYRIGSVVSQSQDGDIMTHLFRFVGGKAVRGSSTRGGVGALKGLLGLIKKGLNCSFAVDGPKGPIYKVKPGVFEVSRLLQLPIYVAGVHCSSRVEFPRSWNKTYLPRPFAKIDIVWLGPYGPIEKSQDPRNEKVAGELTTLLNLAKSRALDISNRAL